MVKTSKAVPQKEEASSSHPAADRTPVEPRPEEFIPGACLLTSDFKVDKGWLVPAVPWIPGDVPDPKSWVRALASTSTYAERSWRDLAKGRWEPKNPGLGRDAVLRSLSSEEEASDPVSKPAEGNKRKRASTSENQKPKARSTRKSRKNTIPLTLESVQRLRDEDEEEEDDGSVLVARSKKTTNAPQTAGSMMVYKAPPRTEDISEKDSGRVTELLEIEDASHRSHWMGDMSEGALPESFRTEENAPSDSNGAVAIEDSPTFPAFSEGAIWDAQTLGALKLDGPHDGKDPFRDLFTDVEDAGGTSDASDLFHGVQQVLNQAVVAHRESCSRSRAELRRYEADLQRATEERKALKLLLGQRGKEIKHLRDELAKAHQDQTDMSEQVMTLLRAYGFDTGTMANLSFLQLQQKLEMIGKLHEEVDVIKADYLNWKGNIDRFAAEKEAARAQLSSVENQLQSLKEKSSVQARKTEELEARLAFDLANAKKIKSDADTFVAVYRVDTEAAQLHAREAKELEADAEALASDDDDDDDDDGDGNKSGSQSGEEPDGEETTPGENQES
ncbi:uncharacterized protein [Nicotiana tomentosiformis]|uniref:uncharacterized protein n=1 Tax=Nicotiana tomentosiformis TaxID=4098 RepID=UPI00388CE622